MRWKPASHPTSTDAMNQALSVRFLAAATAAAAILIGAIGGKTVPLWIIGLAARGGIEPGPAARITMGLCVAAAGILLALGTRGRLPRIAASVVAVALLFSGIADLSAVISLGGASAAALLVPGAQILVGILGFAPILRSNARKEPLGHPRLATFGVVGALLLATGIAANFEVPMPSEGIRRGNPARGSDGRFVVNELTVEDWVGKRIEDTSLQQYLPAVRALVEEQPTLISFYRPNCDGCHDLFDAHFGSRLPVRVIAIRVPPAEGVEMGESDLPEDVFCADCIKLALPEGPVWLVTAPIVVEVVDGVVTCVSTDDYDRCISDAVARAETGPVTG